MIFSILIAIIIALLLIVIIIALKNLKKKEDGQEVSQKIQKKGKSAILKEAEKKLAHDPHNVSALQLIGDIYLSEKDWEKVWNVYKTLYDISSAHPDVDVAKCTLRMGMAAYNLDKNEDAISSLMLSLKKAPDDFDCNMYLVRALLKAGTYDKAVYCLKKAKVMQWNLE